MRRRRLSSNVSRENRRRNVDASTRRARENARNAIADGRIGLKDYLCAIDV